MGRLSTHVLDTTRGAPAAGIRIELFRAGAAARSLRDRERRGPDRSAAARGRASSPGSYRLVFHVGEYFRRPGHPDAGLFLEEVPVASSSSDPRGGTTCRSSSRPGPTRPTGGAEAMDTTC